MRIKKIILALLILFFTSNFAYAAMHKSTKALKMEQNSDNNDIINLLKNYDFTKDFLISSGYDRVYKTHLSFNTYKLFVEYKKMENPNLVIFPRICNGPLLQAYLREGNTNEALNSEINQLAKFEKPDFFLGYEYAKLANLYYRNGDYQEAFKYCKKAVVQDNKISPVALNTMLTLAIKADDLETANEIFNKMEEYKLEKDIPVLLNSAYLKHKKGDFEEEAFDFRRIIASTNFSEARAMAYYMLKEYDNALTEINKEVDSKTCGADCYGLRSLIYRKTEQKKNSQEDYFEATRIDDDSYYTQIAQYFFFKDAGEDKLAQNTLNKFKQGTTPFPLYYFYTYPVNVTNVTIGIPQIFEDK